MNICNKLYETIGHLQILINSNLPKSTLEQMILLLPYPPELKSAICTNPDWSLKNIIKISKNYNSLH